MTDETKKFHLAADLSSIVDYFEKILTVSEREDFSITVEGINRQTKKLSAAAHRQLLMNEAEAVGKSVNSLLGELDHIVADTKSYNDFLQKRVDFWNFAARRLHQIKDKMAESSNSSCGACSQSFSSMSQSNGELQVSIARSNSGEEECKKVETDGPKPPRLSDFKFSDETLNFLQGRESAKSRAAVAAAIPKPPRLEDYQFRTINVSESAAAPRQERVKQLLLQPPEMPQLLASCSKKRTAADGAAKASILASFEGREATDHAGDSGSSKRSVGSLTGSFLADRPMNDYSIIPSAGPLVRADLGFGDKYCFDESSATMSSSRWPATPMSSFKQPERLQESFKAKHGSVRKPEMPVLRTTALDSPSNCGRGIKMDVTRLQQ